MKNLFRWSLTLSLFVGTLTAAELPIGKWTGTYSFAGDESLLVKYRVEMRVSESGQTERAITMDAAGVTIKFNKIQLSDQQLRFQMNPGEEVDCLLKLGEGGTYKGECVSLENLETEQVIKIFMRPPETVSDGSLEETATENTISGPDTEATGSPPETFDSPANDIIKE